MTIEELIRPGDKVDISYVQQMEWRESSRELPKIYKSQVLDLKDNGNLEVAMPSEGGKLVLLPLGIRFEFVFFSRGGLYRAIGQVVERYKSDNVYVLEIELKSQPEKYQRREFFRYPCILNMSYYILTEKEARSESGKALFIQIQGEEDAAEREYLGQIVDLSGGGIRFYTDHELKNGQSALFEIHLENEAMDKRYYIIGDTISCIRTNKSEEMRYEARAKFVIRDDNVREEIIRFIFEEERKTRQRGRG